ncbi:MAG: lysylphosphatidylglycerol synthase transmembrane domain-containing protein [Chitinophagales bacterium]
MKSSNNSNWRKYLLDIVKLAIFLGLGFFLVWLAVKDFSAEDIEEMKTSLSKAKYGWLFLSCFFAIMSHFARALRWQMMIAAFAHKPRFAIATLSLMIGYIANLAFPRLGEVTKCGIMSKYEDVPLDKVFGTVVTDRIIDIFLLFTLTFVVIILQFNLLGNYFIEKIWTPLLTKFGYILATENLLPKIAVIVVALLSAALLWYVARNFKKTLVYQKAVDLVKGVWEGVISVKSVKNMPLFLLYSLFIWVMYFFMIYVCFFALSATEHLGISAALACLVFGTFGFITTQGGIGAYPLAIAGTLALYGITYNPAYAFGWLAWMAQTLLILVAGLVAIGLLPLFKPVGEANKQELGMENGELAMEKK